MPFFFILPVSALFLVIGFALLFFRNSRRLACYLIAVSTGASLVSFGLSTLVLYLVPRMTHGSHSRWSGVALVLAYLIALILGALLGAVGAVLLVLKLPAKKRV